MVWEDIPGRVYSIAAFVILFVLGFIGALIASCIKLWMVRCKPTTAENEAANTTAQIGPYNTVQSGAVVNTVDSGAVNTAQQSGAEKALQLQAYVSENRSQYLVCVVFTVWSDNRWHHQPTNWQYREQGLKCSPHQPST